MKKMYLSIQEYAKTTGLSTVEVKQLIKDGEVEVKEIGKGNERKHVRIKNPNECYELEDVMQRIDILESKIDKLCAHLGIKSE
jgi:hypothetical protein